MRQALADDQLQRIAQREQPALAAQRAHLAHVIHVHDGVAMHAAEFGSREAPLDGL